MNQNQIYLFYIFFLTGILIGVLFDFFRILRKSFKTSDFVTILQDLLFWILASCLLMYTVFKFNNGELRSYVILGISIGLMIYILLFSKIFIKVNVTILTTLKNIISKIFKIVFYPINLICHVIRRVFFRPITFIFINIKNYINLSNIKIKRIVSDKKIKKNTR